VKTAWTDFAFLEMIQFRASLPVADSYGRCGGDTFDDTIVTL